MSRYFVRDEVAPSPISQDLSWLLGYLRGSTNKNIGKGCLLELIDKQVPYYRHPDEKNEFMF
jgi:hypothetical protein